MSMTGYPGTTRGIQNDLNTSICLATAWFKVKDSLSPR